MNKQHQLLRSPLKLKSSEVIYACSVGLTTRQSPHYKYVVQHDSNMATNGTRCKTLTEN